MAPTDRKTEWINKNFIENSQPFEKLIPQKLPTKLFIKFLLSFCLVPNDQQNY